MAAWPSGLRRWLQIPNTLTARVRIRPPPTCIELHVEWIENQKCCLQLNFLIKIGSVAEWSKALVLGTSHFGGVGSNPTTIKRVFCCWKYVRKRWNMTLGHISWKRQSGWPSGLRRCVQVAVYLCRRGFESHFWQRPILSIVRDISSIYVPEIYRWYTVRSGEDHKSCRT